MVRVLKGACQAVKIILTPAILETAYELLRATVPFKGWKLPPSDDVAFKVIAGKDRAADHEIINGVHIIRVSQRDHRSLPALLATLAHEMCHMREYQLGERADVEHSATFKQLGAAVCRHHGFDPGTFRGVL